MNLICYRRCAPQNTNQGPERSGNTPPPFFHEWDVYQQDSYNTRARDQGHHVYNNHGRYPMAYDPRLQGQYHQGYPSTSFDAEVDPISGHQLNSLNHDYGQQDSDYNNGSRTSSTSAMVGAPQGYHDLPATAHTGYANAQPALVHPQLGPATQYHPHTAPAPAQYGGPTAYSYFHGYHQANQTQFPMAQHATSMTNPHLATTPYNGQQAWVNFAQHKQIPPSQIRAPSHTFPPMSIPYTQAQPQDVHANDYPRHSQPPIHVPAGPSNIPLDQYPRANDNMNVVVPTPNSHDETNGKRRKRKGKGKGKGRAQSFR